MRVIERAELAAALKDKSIDYVFGAREESNDLELHIRGAANLTPRDVEAADGLPPDPDAAIVSYSNGGDNIARGAANLLIRRGFSDVREYRAGLNEWAGSGSPAEGTKRPGHRAKRAHGKAGAAASAIEARPAR